LLLDDIAVARDLGLDADSLVFSTPSQRGSIPGSQQGSFGLGPGTSPRSAGGIGGFSPGQISDNGNDPSLSSVRGDNLRDQFEENPPFEFDAYGNFRENTPQLPPLPTWDESPSVVAKARRRRKSGGRSCLDSDGIEAQVRREHEEGRQNAMEVYALLLLSCQQQKYEG